MTEQPPHDRRTEAASLTYAASGVTSLRDESSMSPLLSWITKTFDLPSEEAGRPLLPVGYFANVVKIPGGLGLAIKTDGVGTKILVAEALGKFDTIGIDCVAMNVNDVICVGARPISLVDYIAVEKARPDFLGAIAEGLYRGAEMARISIPGGEIAQVKEMIRGIGGQETGFDLVGMAVGLVAEDRIVIGQEVTPGDAVVGFESSGLHSNGYTLARRTLLDAGRLPLDATPPGFDKSLGLTLLEPTRIYVPEVMELLESDVAVKSLANITGDGFLNLNRIQAECGFVIETLPEPAPIFHLIQETGRITDAQMFLTFNMGVGFCVVVPESDVERTIGTAAKHGTTAWRLGHVTADRQRRVEIRPKRLIGTGDCFEPID